MCVIEHCRIANAHIAVANSNQSKGKKMNKEEAESETQNQNPNSNAANPNNQSQGFKGKGKSCKGCLYYSSALKSNSRNPTCVGIPRTLPQGLFFSLTFYTSFILMINRVSYVLLILLDYFVKTRKKDMY